MNCVSLAHKLLLEKILKGKIMTNSLSNLSIISPTNAPNTNTHISTNVEKTFKLLRTYGFVF